MAENDSELLNTVYRELSERLGMNAAMTIYGMFKSRQISFPTRFFDSSMIHQAIIQEYDGTNIRVLAVKYNYSEKTIRRIIVDLLSQRTRKKYLKTSMFVWRRGSSVMEN